MENQTNILEIPIEVISIIFSFLPRRERFICMWLCTKWRNAMDVPYLWRHMTVRLDVDFFDVATIQLCMEYCRHVRSLEFRFNGLEEQIQWFHFKLKDVTKRTYRFISIFVNKNLQIERLSFNNFGDFHKCKKIFYYLSMFLRSQYKLRTITFNGSYFSKSALVKMISCSVSASRSPIEYLDIRNSYYEFEDHIPGNMSLLSSRFMICIITITNLTVLKIDLASLVTNNILAGFADGVCRALKFIDIRVDDYNVINISHWGFYSDLAWIRISKRFPNLKASISFHDVVYSKKAIEKILIRSVPLYCVRWIGEFTSLRSINFSFLAIYRKTLEIICVEVKFDELDEILCNILRSGPKINCIRFSGVINDLGKVNEMFNKADFDGIPNYEKYMRQAKNRNVYINKARIFKRSENTENIIMKKS